MYSPLRGINPCLALPGSADYVYAKVLKSATRAHCLDPPGDATGIELPSWRWSPDGETVAYIQLGGIYLLSIEDGTTVPLVDDGGITQLDWR